MNKVVKLDTTYNPKALKTTFENIYTEINTAERKTLVSKTPSINNKILPNLEDSRIYFNITGDGNNTGTMIIKKDGKLFKIGAQNITHTVTPTPGAVVNFTDLGDTPNSLTVGELWRTNAAGTALEGIAPGTSGNIVYDNGSIWGSATPDAAGLVDKASAQTIAGQKTFSQAIIASAGIQTASQNALQSSPFGTNAGETGEIRFLELAANGTNYVGFKAPDSIAANVIWTLPDADGLSGGEVLSTDSSGVLSWITVSGGGSLTIGDSITSGTANRVLYEDSSNQLAESGNLQFDGTQMIIRSTTQTPLISKGYAPSGANDGSGELRLGENATGTGRIWYDWASTGALFIDNAWVNNNANILFRSNTNGTAIELMALQGNGKAKIGDGTAFSATAKALTNIHVTRATAPTTLQRNDGYLGLGGLEFASNSYRAIHFGWTTFTRTYMPAFVAYQEKNLGGNTNGDLIFGTRNVTTDTQPEERLRIGASGLHQFQIDDTSTTNAVVDIMELIVNSTGTPAAGLGAGVVFKIESSTTDEQEVGKIESYWISPTHASRAGRIDLSTYYVSTQNVAVSLGSDSSGGLLSFFDATLVSQQSGTGETSGFTAGTGTGVNDDSTFTGNVGSTAYRISDIVKALKNYGLLGS